MTLSFPFRRFSRFSIAICFLTSVFTEKILAADTPKSEPLCVMTYNLRYASDKAPNGWPERRPLMRKVIEKTDPDVMGTQEGLYEQLKNIATDLPDYEWIGMGRDGGSRGEFGAVFYKKKRLEPVAFDYFWLSDSPDLIGSKTWGPTLPRMVTWVKFLDLKTKQEFYFFNTHFDNAVQVAREKSAGLLRERIEALHATIPVILVGDFNADAKKNKAYDTLTEGDFLLDTWNTAKKRENETISTFNSFRDVPSDVGRIDWILTKGDVTADSYEIVPSRKKGEFASDHWPVVAHLRLGQ